MDRKTKLSKRRYTGKFKNRLIIEGFHPHDVNRVIYAFIASNHLLTQGDVTGKIILVDTYRGIRPLYVTGMHTWQKDEFVPQRIAMCEYTGKKYRDITV